MSHVFISKVGRKEAIYIPKHICDLLGIGEGERVMMRVEGDKLVLEFIPDPLSLALKIEKWAKTAVGEFEKGVGRGARMSYSSINVLLNSTYLLPSFGVEVEGLSDKHIAQLIKKHQSKN